MSLNVCGRTPFLYFCIPLLFFFPIQALTVPNDFMILCNLVLHIHLKIMSHKHLDCKDSSSVTLQAQLQHYDSQIHILQENVAKHERAKEEIKDLKKQLLTIDETIQIKCENEQQLFDNVNQNLNAVSKKYDEVQCVIEKLKKENDSLQCRIHLNSVKQEEIYKKIQNLECEKKKIIEDNNKLLDNLHKKQVYLFIIYICTCFEC